LIPLLGEEVNRLTGLIHRVIQMVSLACNLHIGLIQPLTDPHGALAAVSPVDELARGGTL
jgi:hypothetical protein